MKEKVIVREIDGYRVVKGKMRDTGKCFHVLIYEVIETLDPSRKPKYHDLAIPYYDSYISKARVNKDKIEKWVRKRMDKIEV